MLAVHRPTALADDREHSGNLHWWSWWTCSCKRRPPEEWTNKKQSAPALVVRRRVVEHRTSSISFRITFVPYSVELNKTPLAIWIRSKRNRERRWRRWRTSRQRRRDPWRRAGWFGWRTTCGDESDTDEDISSRRRNSRRRGKAELDHRCWRLVVSWREYSHCWRQRHERSVSVLHFSRSAFPHWPMNTQSDPRRERTRADRKISFDIETSSIERALSSDRQSRSCTQSDRRVER